MRRIRSSLVPLLLAIVWPVASGGQEAAVSEQAEVARDRGLYAGTWAMTVDGLETNRGESQMDPLASPPEIDIEITSGDGKGKVLQGIYDVNETRRRLCFRGEQGWCPREFRTQPGDGTVLVTFEKVPTDATAP